MHLTFRYFPFVFSIKWWNSFCDVPLSTYYSAIMSQYFFSNEYQLIELYCHHSALSYLSPSLSVSLSLSASLSHTHTHRRTHTLKYSAVSGDVCSRWVVCSTWNKINCCCSKFPSFFSQVSVVPYIKKQKGRRRKIICNRQKVMLRNKKAGVMRGNMRLTG